MPTSEGYLEDLILRSLERILKVREDDGGHDLLVLHGLVLLRQLLRDVVGSAAVLHSHHPHAVQDLRHTFQSIFVGQNRLDIFIG
jgi:hypothetical protein